MTASALRWRLSGVIRDTDVLRTRIQVQEQRLGAGDVELCALRRDVDTLRARALLELALHMLGDDAHARTIH